MLLPILLLAATTGAPPPPVSSTVEQDVSWILEPQDKKPEAELDAGVAMLRRALTQTPELELLSFSLASCGGDLLTAAVAKNSIGWSCRLKPGEPTLCASWRGTASRNTAADNLCAPSATSAEAPAWMVSLAGALEKSPRFQRSATIGPVRAPAGPRSRSSVAPGRPLLVISAGYHYWLALRTDSGWSVSEEALTWKRQAHEVQFAFDATSLTGRPSVALVASSEDQGLGAAAFHTELLVVDVSDERLPLLARRTIGVLEYSKGQINPATGGKTTWTDVEVSLRPRLTRDGRRLRLELDHPTVPSPKAAKYPDGSDAVYHEITSRLRADAGDWCFQDEQLARCGPPRPVP